MAKKATKAKGKSKPVLRTKAGKRVEPRGARSKTGARKVGRDVSKRQPRGPRHQALPGMEQVRDTLLDRYCEGIGETRDEMAKLRADEAADMQGALTRMRERGLTTYRHAGVEMARVPGEEKLRVRTSKDKATAEVDDSDEGDTATPGVTPLPGGSEFADERAESLEEDFEG